MEKIDRIKNDELKTLGYTIQDAQEVTWLFWDPLLTLDWVRFFKKNLELNCEYWIGDQPELFFVLSFIRIITMQPKPYKLLWRSPTPRNWRRNGLTMKR